MALKIGAKPLINVTMVVFLNLFFASIAASVEMEMGADGMSLSVGDVEINMDTDGDDETLYLDDPELEEGVDESIEDHAQRRSDQKRKANFANADLRNNKVNFKWADLRKANFSNADMDGISFRGADLRRANFSNATFSDCDLRGAIVDGANFSNADFGNTKIGGVDFSRANMTNVDIGRANITDSGRIPANNIQLALTNVSNQPAKVNLYIRFAFDSDTVEENSIKQISNLAEALVSSQLQNQNVLIEGHTDSDGGNAYNLGLSQRRAESVVAILVTKYGIPSSRLTAEGKGEESPVYNNKTEIGKAMNRRVTVVVSNTH